jgi:hypothetical protein
MFLRAMAAAMSSLDGLHDEEEDPENLRRNFEDEEPISELLGADAQAWGAEISGEVEPATPNLERDGIRPK